MSRSADYTIQGFLYQFNKTVLEILKADDDETITVEGIVEDIEVCSPELLTAIQCKYHEAKKTFKASMVYKPLLQMLKHFSDYPNANVRYIIFLYFTGDKADLPEINKSTFQTALASTDKSLKKLIDAIPKNIDLNQFEKKFTMEFGCSFDDITKKVVLELENNGFQPGDVEVLAYPNSIHMIANLSIKHNSADRQITKKKFLFDLNTIRATAISRWTLALMSRDKLLRARRKQLKSHLDINSRLRYFLINQDGIDDYDEEIVIFIVDYIERYHFKVAHTETPVFCLASTLDDLQKIESRLYAKGIKAANGHIGATFHESEFFREPMSSKQAGGRLKREFDIRILSWPDHAAVLNSRKCADLFVIGEIDCAELNFIDINVERLEGATMKELKYIMGISNVYE